jgi:hypothetical protein
MTQLELFLELAKPDENGVSRRIYAYEFVGRYSCLRSGNGYKWPERLQGSYEFTRDGRGDDWSIKLTGFCNKEVTRGIRREIHDIISRRSCEHTGYSNLSSDRIEVDHRNGRYDDERVLNLDTQRLDDFMALSRRANLQKREHCKKCKIYDFRFDARKLGYNVGWVEGREYYEDEVGCKGCYWYSPMEFRKSLVKNEVESQLLTSNFENY